MNLYPDLQVVTSTPSPIEFRSLAKVNLLSAALSIFCLFYDYGINFAKERRLVWKASNKGVFLATFLFARYWTLCWTIFMLFSWTAVASNPSACQVLRFWPQGTSIALFASHTVLAIRVWAIWSKQIWTAILLGAMLSISLLVEIVANMFVQPVLIPIPENSYANSICFVTPSSLFFSASFILPSISGHLILILTLIKSILHLRLSKSRLMSILQRDHFFFVLAICLVNFANVVLVLQTNLKYFRTINLLPAMVITQLLLSRVVFGVRSMCDALGGVHGSLQRVSRGQHSYRANVLPQCELDDLALTPSNISPAMRSSNPLFNALIPRSPYQNSPVVFSSPSLHAYTASKRYQDSPSPSRRASLDLAIHDNRPPYREHNYNGSGSTINVHGTVFESTRKHLSSIGSRSSSLQIIRNKSAEDLQQLA